MINEYVYGTVCPAQSCVLRRLSNIFGNVFSKVVIYDDKNENIYGNVFGTKLCFTMITECILTRFRSDKFLTFKDKTLEKEVHMLRPKQSVCNHAKI